MCLSPITLNINARSICADGAQLLKSQVPCGTCAECVKAKRNEWFIRSYYEMRHTHSQGGYVYFDTLTYNDENIPRLSHYVDVGKYGIKDFTCFRLEDIRNFFKRLRRQIAYHYGIKNQAFKYFLTSEYGSDPRFTHRPHYHVLFYVTAPILPHKLSRLVAKCWTLGRTDGLPYQSVNYVNQHIYYKLSSNYEAISSVCMYVSKYVTKSSSFVNQLERRKQQLLTAFTTDNDGKITSLCNEDDIKVLFRQIDMFHRQSQGFGLSYLNNIDARTAELLEDDKCQITYDLGPVLDHVYPLPMYYKRKLYYKCKRRDDGTYYWQLTEAGFKHFCDVRVRSVDTIATQYMDMLNNADTFYSDAFFRFLGKRDISELVIYERFYKGRMRDSKAITYYPADVHFGLTDTEANLYDWMQLQRKASLVNSSQDVHNVVEFPDGQRICIDLSDKYSNLFIKTIVRNYNKNDFYEKFTFNQNSCAEFQYFDDALSVIQFLRKQSAVVKQNTFDYQETLKEKLKDKL